MDNINPEIQVNNQLEKRQKSSLEAVVEVLNYKNFDPTIRWKVVQ